MKKDLPQLLLDASEEASVLEANGAAFSVRRVRELLGEIAEAAEPYTRFIVEADARIYSNKSVEWLRGHFPEWEAEGHAKRVQGKRWYRLIVLPRRPDLEAAREAGRRAAGEARRAS